MRLAFIRHGTAEPSSLANSDIDRNLSEVGKIEVQRLASFLSEENFKIELIISSSASRTQETSKIILSKQSNASVVVEPKFYLASLDEVEDKLSTTPSKIENIALIGHNPGWSDSIFELTGHFVNLQPSSCYILETQLKDWASAIFDRSSWKISKFWNP